MKKSSDPVYIDLHRTLPNLQASLTPSEPEKSLLRLSFEALLLASLALTAVYILFSFRG